MSTLKPDWWQSVSPYLERALEMGDAERAVWLASLRKEDSAVASHVEELLQEHQALVQEGFLEQCPQTSNQPALAGQTIGAYTLESPIGEGGMGSVWLARRSDGQFEGRVAVKLLRTHLLGPGGRERFKREGTILVKLADPHIAQLL